MRARKFDRWNQPVPCRMCGKLTTWTEVNGYSGLDLCRPCFDEAGAENERLDGHTAPEPAPLHKSGLTAVEIHAARAAAAIEAEDILAEQQAEGSR